MTKIPEKDGDKKKKKAPAKKAEPKEKEESPVPKAQLVEEQKYLHPAMLKMKEAYKKQAENIFPLNTVGQTCNPGLAPTLIREVYFPPEAPLHVSTLIESALVYQNDENAEMSLQCFEQARSQWIQHVKTVESKTQLKKEQELFFELCVASVHEGAGNYETAI